MSASQPGSPEDPENYSVGNRRPPRETRFKPGQSGNPRGKAKGASGIAAQIKKQLQRKITVTENGRKRRLTLQEVMLASFAAKAAKGDLKSAEFLIRMQEKYQDSAVRAFDIVSLPAEDRELIDAYFARRTEGNHSPTITTDPSVGPTGGSTDRPASLEKSGEGEAL
jgi:uncharacterized protein DUF5681